MLKRVILATVIATQLGCASPWVRIPLTILASGAQGAQQAAERARDRQDRERTCVSRRQPDGSVETVCR